MAADDSEWFIEQLRRQFADHQLEEAGVVLEFYLDAKNVRGAAVGVQGVNVATADLSKPFDDPERESLVECLFSAGWLGPIRMLAPHQAEFLGLLNDAMDVGDERDFDQRSDAYLKKIEFINTPEWAIREISSRSLAQRTFKAIELTRLFWRKKIARWRADDLLRTDTLPTDFAGMIGSPVYNNLRERFDKHRPNNKRSNLADAVALTALAAEVEHFRSDSGARRLPLFFAPQLFVDVVAEAGLAEKFEYRAENQAYSVLCDADYFLFRSILYPAENVIPGESITEIRRRLEEVRRKLQRMILTKRTMDEMLLELVADDRHGLFDADQIRNYSFFDQVWIPVAAAAELQEVNGSFRSVVQLMQSSDVRKAISTDLQDLTADLRHNTLQYLRARRVQPKLASAVAKFKIEVPAAMLHESPLDILGLVRFSFPHAARDQLRRLFARFGAMNAESAADNSPDPMTKAVFRALWSPRKTTATDPVVQAVNAGLLWIAKLYPELVDRVGPHRHLHFSLTAIYGAAAVECQRMDLAERAAQELEVLLNDATRAETRGEILVALSYLHYHRALNSGFIPCWEEERLSTDLEGVVARDFVEKAVDYARSAAGNKSLDPSLHVYALNLAVFYGVSLPQKDRSRLRQLAVQLLQYKQRSIWQYRYEDTIARYFFLIALEATSAEELERNLRFAERHITQASKEAPYDQRISTFESYLTIIRPVVEARFRDRLR
jgi:hypothetical protein